MQIDVQNRKTKDLQGHIEDIINDQLLPLFKIFEWKFKFKVIEQKDELRAQQIDEIKARTAMAWLQCGFDVELDEDGNLEVTGSGVSPAEQQQQQMMGGFPGGEEAAPPPEVSEESGGWVGDMKSMILEAEGGEEALAKTHPKLPRGTKTAAVGMEAELLEVLKWARRNRKQKDVLKRATSKGYKIIDHYYQVLDVVTRNHVSMKMGETVGDLPPEMRKQLVKLRGERKRDFRRILRDEIKR